MKNLNFVIDVGVGKLIENWLREEGHIIFAMMTIEKKCLMMRLLFMR